MMRLHFQHFVIAVLAAVLTGSATFTIAVAATESTTALPANWQFISQHDDRNRIAAEEPYLLNTVANHNANLRAGPGTNYQIIGNRRAGQNILIIGQNPAGDWLQVDPGFWWIARFLVDGVEGITWPVTSTLSEPSDHAAQAQYMLENPDFAQMYAARYGAWWLTFSTGNIAPAVPAGQAAQVVNIVDGDTIDVVINGQQYRVRYILMDTPERGQPFFTQATEANRRLVSGKTVYLVKDVSETDRYGRLLRYIYLEDGTFVNAELVRLGYAQIATFPPDVSKVDEIRVAQVEAQAHGRGLWADAAPQRSGNERDIAELNRLAREQPHLLDTFTNRNANIRSGPGTQYSIERTVTAGSRLLIIGQNSAGDWLQIDPGFWWIARFLVDGAEGITWPVATFAPIASPEPVRETPICDCSYNRYNCADFSTHAQAQACFLYCIAQGQGDIHRLDGDNDGLACEALP